MSEFLILLRGGEFDSYSEDEMQKIIQRYSNWVEKLRQRDLVAASAKLKDDGRLLRREESGIVDGPFAETKEAIGGFFMVKAENYEEAVAISRDCPHLEYGGDIEIREIDAR